jgi:hypothetical protein
MKSRALGCNLGAGTADILQSKRVVTILCDPQQILGNGGFAISDGNAQSKNLSSVQPNKKGFLSAVRVPVSTHRFDSASGPSKFVVT